MYANPHIDLVDTANEVQSITFDMCLLLRTLAPKLSAEHRAQVNSLAANAELASDKAAMIADTASNAS